MNFDPSVCKTVICYSGLIVPFRQINRHEHGLTDSTGKNPKNIAHALEKSLYSFTGTFKAPSNRKSTPIEDEKSAVSTGLPIR